MLLCGAGSPFAVELPLGVDGLRALVADGSLDSTSAAAVAELYAEPLCVPRGDYVRFLRQWPQLCDGVIPDTSVLFRYLPWHPSDIARFFEDYPALNGFSPVLSFETGYSKTRAFMNARIRCVGFDTIGDCRVRVGGTLRSSISAELDCRVVPQALRLGRRVLSIGRDRGTLSVGNFIPVETDPLLWGRFHSLAAQAFESQSVSDNLLMGGVPGFNGVMGRYLLSPNISADGFYHRDAEMAGWHGAVTFGPKRLRLRCAVDHSSLLANVNNPDWYYSGALLHTGAFGHGDLSGVFSLNGGVALRGGFEGAAGKRVFALSGVWFSKAMRPVGSAFIGRVGDVGSDWLSLTLQIRDTLCGPIRISGGCGFESGILGDRLSGNGSIAGNISVRPSIGWRESYSTVNGMSSREIACAIKPAFGMLLFDLSSALIISASGSKIRYGAGVRSALPIGNCALQTGWEVRDGSLRSISGSLTHAMKSTWGSTSIRAAGTFRPGIDEATRFELTAVVGTGSPSGGFSRW